MSTAVRERTITWDDPLATASRGMEMDGLSFLRAVMAGEIPPPPIAQVMRFDILEAEEGRVVFSGQPSEEFYNPIGVVHAGFVMTLADSALGCAVQSTLPRGMGYTTLETKVNMTRPITLDTGTVLGEGVVLHSGRTTAVAECKITAQKTGKLLGFASTTCAILKP